MRANRRRRWILGLVVLLLVLMAVGVLTRDRWRGIVGSASSSASAGAVTVELGVEVRDEGRLVVADVTISTTSQQTVRIFNTCPSLVHGTLVYPDGGRELEGPAAVAKAQMLEIPLGFSPETLTGAHATRCDQIGGNAPTERDDPILISTAATFEREDAARVDRLVPGATAMRVTADATPEGELTVAATVELHLGLDEAPGPSLWSLIDGALTEPSVAAALDQMGVDGVTGNCGATFRDGVVAFWCSDEEQVAFLNGDVDPTTGELVRLHLPEKPT